MANQTPQSENPELLIYKGDSYDRDYASYYADNKYDDFRKTVRDRRYSVGSTRTPYRVINECLNKRLLPEGGLNENGWKKFTFNELVWIQSVKRMRGFGVSLEKISQVKDQILIYSKSAETYLEFEFYVFKAWLSNDDPYIVIFGGNHADVATSKEIEITKLFKQNRDMLLISLKSILEELGCTVVKPDTLTRLNQQEKEILAALRLENYKKIELDLKDGNLKEITFTETYSSKETLRDLERGLKENSSHAEMNTKFRDGVPQITEIKKRKRF